MWGKTKYKLVEVPAARPQPTVEGAELREGLKGLHNNPYFAWILNRLQTQRLALEGRLKGTRFNRIEDASFIQQGVFWTGWLEAEINRLTAAPPKAELAPEAREEAALSEIDAMLERVGVEATQGRTE